MTGKRNKVEKQPETATEALYKMYTPDLRVEMPLRGLLALCREFGVLHFEGSIPGTPSLVKFSLAPVLASDPQPVRASEPREPAAQPQAAVKESTKKVGADGLTAEQQSELYDRPMDAKG